MDLNKPNIIMNSSEMDIYNVKINDDHGIYNNLTSEDKPDSVIENNIVNEIVNEIVNGKNVICDVSKNKPTILHTHQRSRIFDNSNNNINSITLEFFANNGLYNKYLHKTTVENSISQSDKKFYKRRIINETKQMLKEEFNNENLRDIFNKYIFSLISHFKLSDTHEFIQKEFTEPNSDVDISGNQLNPVIEESNKDDSIPKYSPYNPDELLFKKDTKTLTMDKFVNKKSKQKEKPNIPFKKNINLREPELKMKGIQKKEKKENIDNIQANEIKKI
jgi:hypothetical protein